MKIGIITLNGYYNYGNRLQNYALSQSLLKLATNIQVDNIWYGERALSWERNSRQQVFCGNIF